MSDKKLDPTQIPDAELSDSSLSDKDAARLEAMGYKQDLNRNFSVWTLLGVASSLTNAWFAISTALVTGISSGGPVVILYGILWIVLISTCVGITLSELASAMPNAGGQTFWAGELAPRKYANLASYLTGWFAWAGSIFTSASVVLGLASAGMGMWQLAHPDLYVPCGIFVAYQVINAFAFIFNCVGKLLPKVATVTLYTAIVSFFVIIITVPATAHTHQDAKFVFATFINSTGWKADGIAFIVGLMNANWVFACLDCATHLAEEVPKPERSIPIAIMATIAISGVTSFFYCMSMFFSLSGFQSLIDSPTGVPILALFYQAVDNKAGAIVLETLVLVTGIGCQIASHTWQSRLCWSFARDKGIPFHKFLSKVDKRLGVPFNAHASSCFIVGLLGLLYLGSSAAFDSMVSACIVLLYISYTIPITCLLIRGRNNIKHGPFWLGPIGLFSNIVVLLWTLFTLVMYSFPGTYPVAPSSMNYVCVVYFIVVLIIATDWFVRGRKKYRVKPSCTDDTEITITR